MTTRIVLTDKVFRHDEFVELIGADFVITNRTVVDGDGNIISKGLNRFGMTPVADIPRKTTTETKPWLKIYI